MQPHTIVYLSPKNLVQRDHVRRHFWEEHPEERSRLVAQARADIRALRGTTA